MNNEQLLIKLQNEFEDFRGITVTKKQLQPIKKSLKKLDAEWLTRKSKADIPWVSLAAQDLIDQNSKLELDQIDRETARRLLFK